MQICRNMQRHLCDRVDPSNKLHVRTLGVPQVGGLPPHKRCLEHKIMEWGIHNNSHRPLCWGSCSFSSLDPRKTDRWYVPPIVSRWPTCWSGVIRCKKGHSTAGFFTYLVPWFSHGKPIVVGSCHQNVICSSDFPDCIGTCPLPHLMARRYHPRIILPNPINIRLIIDSRYSDISTIDIHKPYIR